MKKKLYITPSTAVFRLSALQVLMVSGDGPSLAPEGNVNNNPLDGVIAL
jgi:hypothetical protein